MHKNLLNLSILVLFVLFMTSCIREAYNLGTPVKSMSIRGSLLVTDPVTGRPTYYSGMYTSSGTARLIRFDYALNKVEYFPLPGTKGVYGLAEGPDGKIYCGTIIPARIFSFDPVTRIVTDLGSAAGESYIFELRKGPDGLIYGCTYPKAKVVAYDPVLGGITDLGSMHSTSQYCEDVAIADNGKIFCGIGANIDLVVYDPATKEKKSILPAGFEDADAIALHTENNILYASIDGTLFIIDANDYSVLLKFIPPEGGWIGTHIPKSGGPVVIHGLPEGFMKYNAVAGKLEHCDTPNFKTYEYDSAAGLGFVRTGGRQLFEAHNLDTGELISRVDVSGDGDGMDVFSLETGPDGCIYGGSVSLLHIFKYDPSTGILKDLGFPYTSGNGEFYSMHTTGDKIYMAAYSYSELSVYTPSEPWNPGVNPKWIGPAGDDQNRPHAMTSSADGRIFIGSEPDYGEYGGALSIYDPVSGSFEGHRNIIPNQTILSLTAGTDGLIIYGGSSTRGGTGTEPITENAHFFAWDVLLGKLVLDIVPVSGADDIEALTNASDGRIYGCADSTLFVFDPVPGKIIYKQRVFQGSITKMITGTDGYIYCRTGKSIMRFKPLSGKLKWLSIETLYRSNKNGRGLALGPDGKVYFGAGTELYVIDSL
ncbi:MAG TPA: hypothetical protein VIS94_01245 [Desulfomonilia bacterium]